MSRISNFLSFAKKGVLVGLLAAVLLPTTMASAQSTREACEAAGRVWIEGAGCVAAGPGTEFCEGGGRGFLGFPTWHVYLEVSPVSGRCAVVGPTREDNSDQIDWRKAAPLIGIAVLEIMLRLAGILAAAYVIVGAFQYILSQGEPDRAKSARSTIINALVGLVITITAVGIVTFVGNRFGG